MGKKTTVGELVYKITGDDNEYNKVINNADQKTEALAGTMTKSKGATDGLVKSLAGAYLGIQGVKMIMSATVGEAIKYEDAFAGVRKTVDATDEQLNALSDQFVEMSKTIPVTVEELASIGEMGGALGVPIESMAKFTEVIAEIGVTTNLTTEQASNDFARFASIMQLPLGDVDRLGSAIVALGNDGASTETEITAMALRIAGAGSTIGLTTPQVLGWAAALSNVGIEAEAGGTSISKMMIDIASAVSKGGKDLNNFAKVAGMSAKEFEKKYKEDANGALIDFVNGLKKVKEGGGDVLAVIDKLGITEVRQRDAVLRLVSADDVLSDAMGVSAEGFDKNNALSIEAEKRFKTTASQIQILKNNWFALSREIGNVALPVLNQAIKMFINVAEVAKIVGTAVKASGNIIGNGMAIGLVKAMIKVDDFMKNVVDKVNGFLQSIGSDTRYTFKSIVSDDTRNSLDYLWQNIDDAQKSVQDALMNSRDANEVLAQAQQYLQDSTDDTTASMENFDDGLESSGKKSTELADNYEKLTDETKNLSKKGTEAIRDLAENTVRDLKAIETKIAELQGKLIDLKEKLAEDLINEDKGMAEKFVEEEQALADLKQELAEKQRKATEEETQNAKNLLDIKNQLAIAEQKRAEFTAETSESTRMASDRTIKNLQEQLGATDQTGSDIADLQAEIAVRETALKNAVELEKTLQGEITEARRIAGLTELERAIEEYEAKKLQIQKEYDEQVVQVQKEIDLKTTEKDALIDLSRQAQEQIAVILKLGNERFQELSNERVAITDAEVKKQLEYYDKLNSAIGRATSAKATTELPLQEQFANGGYVRNGGQVHPNEYVIPSNMVNSMPELIGALEAVRSGRVSNTSNSVVMNNNISEQIDMNAVLKDMSFELNK